MHAHCTQTHFPAGYMQLCFNWYTPSAFQDTHASTHSNAGWCAQPGVAAYEIILTPDGQSAGFATYVEALLQKAVDLGLKVNFDSRIMRIMEQEGGGFMMETLQGVVCPWHSCVKLGHCPGSADKCIHDCK